MAKKNLPLSKVYQLLEPGPVVLVSTAPKGRMSYKQQTTFVRTACFFT